MFPTCATEIFPMASNRWENDPNAMTKDAFITGLEAYLADRPDLKPATVSAAAGLDKATIRKMLTGEGTRAPRVDTAEKIAAALGTTAEGIRNYVRGGTVKTSPAAHPGFAESPVEAWAPPPGTPDPTAFLAPGTRSAALYCLNIPAPGFALTAGDILAVDLRRLPVDGDTILAGITDPATNRTRTEVRRFFDDMAISLDPGATEPALRLDGNDRAVWRGTITGVMRRYQ